MVINVPPTRTTPETGLLGDIESHLYDGHPFKNRDKVTWAHEGTHGINASIRNKYNGHNNAAYVLNDQAFLLDEPNFTLRDVADAVPQELRGSGYGLYLVSQQRWWNDHPLYVYDELAAYLNSTRIGMDVNADYDRVLYSFRKTIEFLGYARILIDVYCRTNNVIGDEELDEFPSYVLLFITSNLRDFPDARDQYENVEKYVYLWHPNTSFI